jgi:hypothetical protein
MACLHWLLQRVGSNWVAGVSPKALDSRAQPQPSATQAPGAEQVEHTSSGASESGEAKDVPRLPSHAVDVLPPLGRGGRCLQHLLEFGPHAFVCGAVVFSSCRVQPARVLPTWPRCIVPALAPNEASSPGAWLRERGTTVGVLPAAVFSGAGRQKAGVMRATNLCLNGGCVVCPCVVSLRAGCQ